VRLKKPKKPSKSKLKRQADRLFSLIIRSRGRCQKCGTVEKLQCAHVVSRRYAGTRWNELNAFCLCSGDHMYFTYRPLEWDEWCINEMGQETWSRLRWEALKVTKPDYPMLVESLRQRAHQLGIAA